MILSPFQEVFVNMYENLIDLWINSGELDYCVVALDVSYLGLPTSEWVNAINNNFHVHNGKIIQLSASAKSEEIFGKVFDTLIVKLTEVPEIYSDELKA